VRQLTPQELLDLHLFWEELQQQEHRQLAEAEGLVIIDGTEDKTVIGIIVGGALGAFFLPGLLGVGLLTGALLGGSIGYKVANLFGKKSDDKKEEKFGQFSGFDSGGSLVLLNSPIPIVLGNRDINPAGGARVSGFLIAAYVETKAGAQYLHQLYTLGLGEVGRIDESSLLINDQSRNNFLVSEVTTETRHGVASQPAYPGMPFYSQVVAPNSNSQFGVDKRAEVQSSTNIATRVALSFTNLRNCFVSGETITKNSGTNAWDGGAFSVQRFNPNAPGPQTYNFGYVEFIAQGTTELVACGLSRDDPDGSVNTIDYAISLDTNGLWRVRENGAIIYTSTDFRKAGDVFRVELTPARRITYLRNGVVFYTSTVLPTFPLFVDTSIWYVNTKIGGLKLYSVATAVRGAIPTTGSTTSITVEEEDFERFTPSELYQVNRGGASQNFSLVDQNAVSKSLTVTPTVNLVRGDKIYAYFVAKYETTKRVSELHLNCAFSLYARDEENELLPHGSLFDLFLRGDGGVFVRIARFLVATKNPNPVYRGIRLKNLPLGKWFVELRPLPAIENSAIPIRRISGDGKFATISSGVTLGGKLITYEVENQGIISAAEASKLITYDEKTQVSTEQGPSGRIITVNEVVTLSALGRPAGSNRYPGFATIYHRFLASNRINSAPNTSVLVRRGWIGRQHLAAGVAGGGSSGATLADVAADFTNQGVNSQCIVRNLSKRIESPVSTHGSNVLTSIASLRWEAGDRYLVYSRTSSCFFPDHYANLLADPIDGLGAKIDADNFIDYPSIVEARRFCAANKFYWDGIIDKSIPFPDWATQEAAGSLLFTSRIDGRWGLVPERDQPVSAIFNSANILVDSFEERYVDWSEQELNTVIITYEDGADGRFEQKTAIVQTQEAFNGSVDRVEESLTMLSIKNAAQAIKFAQVFLKTRRQQDRVCQFQTDLQALYVQPGDLMIVQHRITEYELEISGVVTLAEPFNAGTQTITLSKTPAIEVGSTYRAAVLFKRDGSTQAELVVDAFVDNGVTQLSIQGLRQALQVQDLVVVGKNIQQDSTYRVAKIGIEDDGTATINGVIWRKTMLDPSGLVTIG